MASKLNLTADVLDTLRAARIEGPKLYLVGQLDRALYMKVNKALEVLGGKWDRKAKAHLFTDDPGLVIEEALEAGAIVYTDERKELNFFPTPTAVVTMMLGAVLDPALRPPSLRILEPSAGKGAILEALMDRGADTVDFCEISPAFHQALVAIPGAAMVGEDFLAYNPEEPYDLIVANPPFSKGRDIAHAMHMLDMLAPGGRLACILSAGVLFRDDRATATFHARLLSDFPTHSLQPLPEGAFKESGTMVRTVLLTAQARANDMQMAAKCLATA